MRPMSSVFALMVLGACSSNWEAVTEVDTDLALLPFYYDFDGDGWGDPEVAPREMVSGDESEGFTARNDRDCDDSSPEVTGLVGSICPQGLMGSDTVYAADVYGGNEFIVVGPTGTATTDDPLDWGMVWPQYAEDACSPWGWGGGLAEFSGTDDAKIVKDLVAGTEGSLLEDGQVFAAWVGIVADGTTWKWESGEGVALDQIGFCGEQAPAVPADPARQRLALVRQLPNRWCLGFPEDALKGNEPAEPPPYEQGFYAYFVCERPIPDPDAYALDTIPAG